MSGTEDQRVDPRFPMVLRVDFPDRAQLLDMTENLSSSGLFVRTEQAFAQGETVALQVSFPGLLEPVAVSGQVAWLRPSSAATPAGVGVKVSDADRQKLQGLLEAIHAPQPVPGAAGYRVLIVEDNPHIVEMYAYVLKKLSRVEMGGKVPLEVAFAADGHEAFNQLKEARFDLVLTDLYMPVLDGFGLVLRIREDPQLAKIPVVVISAGGPEAQARAAELGVDVYLRKPVRFVEVLETVKGLLKIR